MFDPREYIRQIATHYPDSDSARRILEFADVDILPIDLEGAPLNVWFDAMSEVHRQDKLEKLLEIIGMEYNTLQIDLDNLQHLKKFLTKDKAKEPVKNTYTVQYTLLGISVILSIILFLLFIGKCRQEKEIHVVLHENGNRVQHIIPDFITIRNLRDEAAAEVVVQQNGHFLIKNPKAWMVDGPVRLVAQKGTGAAQLTLDTTITLTAHDTNWIAIHINSEKQLPVYTFMRLQYNGHSFVFPADASVLMLKKYIMTVFDSKAGLPADRQILLYGGREWSNEVLLNDVPWTEDRSVSLQYRLSSPNETSFVTIQVEGMSMEEGLPFLDNEPGEVIDASELLPVIRFPKLTGQATLKIFFQDSLLLMPVTTGYSDMAKYFTRDDYGKHLQQIRRVVK